MLPPPCMWPERLSVCCIARESLRQGMFTFGCHSFCAFAAVLLVLLLLLSPSADFCTQPTLWCFSCIARMELSLSCQLCVLAQWHLLLPPLLLRCHPLPNSPRVLSAAGRVAQAGHLFMGCMLRVGHVFLVARRVETHPFVACYACVLDAQHCSQFSHNPTPKCQQSVGSAWVQPCALRELCCAQLVHTARVHSPAAAMSSGWVCSLPVRALLGVWLRVSACRACCWKAGVQALCGCARVQQ